MKNTLNLGILALSLGFMTAVSSCDPKPAANDNAADTTSKVEVKTVDTTKTVTPDSTATTTTTDVKKEETTK